MAQFDIFNGDADGILALLQLRKARPMASHKITGVKRDIALLQRCDAKEGDSVTVLDVSMEKNAVALQALLAKGVNIFYADHHRVGEAISHPLLEQHIDLSASTCTSLIIDSFLDGQYRAWAIAAAFGDNLIKVASALCEQAGLSAAERDFLCELGTLINYNGYGASLCDLHFAPEALFALLMQYNSPFDLLTDQQSPYFLLKKAYEQDMEMAANISPFYSDDSLYVLQLPDEPFSRRISGVLSNKLVNDMPDKAHLVLSLNKTQDYTVSLRAPLHHSKGADEICSAFATGGGRAGAAGINQLPQDLVQQLIQQTSQYYAKC